RLLLTDQPRERLTAGTGGDEDDVDVFVQPLKAFFDDLGRPRSEGIVRVDDEATSGVRVGRAHHGEGSDDEQPRGDASCDLLKHKKNLLLELGSLAQRFRDGVWHSPYAGIVRSQVQRVGGLRHPLSPSRAPLSLVQCTRLAGSKSMVNG